jgi:hypothetical protein
VRWGVDFGDHHMVDFGAASVDNGSWPSLSLGGWGSPCDNDPPAANPVHTPPANGAGWNNTAVTVNWNWTDPLVSPPEIKLPGGLVIGGGPPHASGIRPVTCQTTTTSASVEGETEMVASCADVEYNRGEARHFVRIDRTPPVVHCAAADGQWHAADVSLPCTGADALSGLVNPGDHQFSLTTSVPANTETAAALTGSRTVADLAGNTTTAPAIGGNRVDKKSPIIGIVQPAATTYTHSATLVLDYGVTDGGSGVAAVVPAIDGSTTVAGNPLPNGRAIPLVSSLPLGTHTFTIDATDAVGNTSKSSVTFTIIVTAESIMESVAQLMQAGGGVEQRGNSLMGILANAAANRRVGNCRAAANQYNAFIKHVQAQTSKSIAPVAAAILIADAQYLIAHCP